MLAYNAHVYVYVYIYMYNIWDDMDNTIAWMIDSPQCSIYMYMYTTCTHNISTFIHVHDTLYMVLMLRINICITNLLSPIRMKKKRSTTNVYVHVYNIYVHVYTYI